ncbi:hypothetical protein V8D89_009588 [Ganoderma adspersum]
MSQTSSSLCLSTTPAPFNRRLWDDQAHGLQESLVIASVPAALYGLFTILCAASIYALTQRRSGGRIRIPAIVLALTLLILFISTTVYLVYTILSVQSGIMNTFLYSANVLWPIPYGDVEIPTGLFKDYNMAQQCAGTATLTINILLGDAIVCWRACVLWHRSRLVKGICIAFLLTTFALGIVDTRFTCAPSNNSFLDRNAVGTGSMYSGVSSGVAASVLSFSTNLCATVLVGYKAWEARRRLREYIVAGPMASQMEKVFALLVESGAAYCALWAVVVAWQIGDYQKIVETNSGNNTFWDIFDVIIKGALVPLIAIYPTIIIVLVALNRSHVENGMASTGQTSSSGASIRLTTVRVDTTVASHYEHHHQSPLPRRSEVLIIGEREFGLGSISASEAGASTHAVNDERKLDGII